MLPVGSQKDGNNDQRRMRYPAQAHRHADMKRGSSQLHGKDRTIPSLSPTGISQRLSYKGHVDFEVKRSEWERLHSFNRHHGGFNRKTACEALRESQQSQPVDVPPDRQLYSDWQKKVDDRYRSNSINANLWSATHPARCSLRLLGRV